MAASQATSILLNLVLFASTTIAADPQSSSITSAPSATNSPTTISGNVTTINGTVTTIFSANVTLVSTTMSNTSSATPSQSMGATATAPSNLRTVTATPFTELGRSPFYSITALGLENNWLLATGPARPNVQNLTKTKTTTYDQIWMTRINTTTPWVWSWSSNFSSVNPNNTLADSTHVATYTAMSVKHSPLQLDPNMLFLVNSVSNTIDVLTYWWLSPRESPFDYYPPRSVPLPQNATQVSAMTTLENHYGVYIASGHMLYWIPVCEPYTPGPPKGSNAFVTPTVSVNTPTGTSNGSIATLVTPTVVPASAEQWGSSLVHTFNGSVQAMWLKQDFQNLFVAEGIAGTVKIGKWVVAGPAKIADPGMGSSGGGGGAKSTSVGSGNGNGTSSAASASATQGTLNDVPATPYFTPLITLNATTYPPLPSTANARVTALMHNPSSNELYVTTTNSNQVWIFNADNGLLVGVLNCSFGNLWALELDNNGGVLYVAGDDGSEGRVDAYSFNGKGVASDARGSVWGGFNGLSWGVGLAVLSGLWGLL
ncbi:hypothetical protein HDU76_006458 [Blyttiomyces sp. JEL0837]|nr:hypothetical protein HDU76_006458 [Blyttiomyces sp. JEL0837]